MKQAFSCTLASCLFLGCVSASSAKQAEDYLAGLKSKPQSSQSIPGSVRFKPVALRRGQFVHYLITQSDNSTISYRLHVLRRGELPFSYWLEEELISGPRSLVARSLIVMDDSRIAVASQDPETFEPILPDFGRVARVLEKEGPPPVLGGTDNDEPFSERTLSPGVRLDSLPALGVKVGLLGQLQLRKGRKLQVKAGQFAGCIDASFRSTVQGQDLAFSACLDGQVPLWGLVQAKDSLGRRWELVEFGIAAPAPQ